MSEFTPKGFSNGQYVDRFLLRDKLYEEDAITMGGVAILNNFPAADVVEVRHERWELAKDPFGAGYVKCSRCGYKHCPEYYPDGSAIMHLFCPSCGAVMDGGQEE